MLGPVPASAFATVLTDLEGAVRRSYSLFGLADETPEIRYQVGRVATVDGTPDGCSDLIWINLNQVQPGTNVAGDSPCSVLPDLVVQIDVQRCWPVPDDGGRVDVAAEKRATLRLAQDATVLWYGLMSQRASGELLPSFDGIACDAIRPLATTPVGPLGGSAGFAWQFRISMVGMMRDR